MKKYLVISSALLVGTISFFVMSTDNSVASSSSTPSKIEKTSEAHHNQALTTSSQPRTVVELFTSQGCSSCPPANRLAAEVAQDEDKLVLTYGVTYWDYLGWKDTFGNPEFTTRQRQYGKSLGSPNIYTPQLILNGDVHSPRYTAVDINNTRLADELPKAKITIQDGQLLLTSDVSPDDKLVIVSFKPGEQFVDVQRGENGGRRLKLANVVIDVMPLTWTGHELDTELTPETGLAYAALFQHPREGYITTAAVYMP